MKALIPSDSPVHFLLPLPPGIPDRAPELFGFYTYELRPGHAKGWSTAQGRFGSSLRVTGVQHPAPALTCMVLHNRNGISARRSICHACAERPLSSPGSARNPVVRTNLCPGLSKRSPRLPQCSIELSAGAVHSRSLAIRWRTRRLPIRKRDVDHERDSTHSGKPDS